MVAIDGLSLGCAQLGNLYRDVPDEEARATVDGAWAAGVRYFDTAPHYGLGLSERRLGAALAGRPRDDYVVSTKVGRALDPVVYLHDPDDHWDEVLATGYPALAELRAEGAVSAIGAGMNQSGMLAALVRHTDVDVLMLAGRYTLLEQDSLDDLLPLCRQRDVGIVAAGVFNSGLLARPRPADDGRYDYGDAPSQIVRRAREIAAVCERHGTTLPAAAIAFPLAHPAVLSVCVGARSAEQIEQNASLYREAISPDLWVELKADGLLRKDAPVPP
jgi:D-threo-aldose 1-dehydrogenase